MCSSTDLGPSLFGLYDKLAPSNRRNAINSASSVKQTQVNVTTHKGSNNLNINGQASSKNSENEYKTELYTTNCNKNDLNVTIEDKILISELDASEETYSSLNTINSKKVRKNFSFLSPNVQRIISNSTTSLEDETINSNESVKVRINKPSNLKINSSKNKRNNFPLSNVTCKLSQSSIDLNKNCETEKLDISDTVPEEVRYSYIDTNTDEESHLQRCSKVSDESDIEKKCDMDLSPPNIFGVKLRKTSSSKSFNSSQNTTPTNATVKTMEDTQKLESDENSSLPSSESELLTPKIEITPSIGFFNVIHPDNSDSTETLLDGSENNTGNSKSNHLTNKTENSNDGTSKLSLNNASPRPLSVSSIGSSSSISSGGGVGGSYGRGEGGSEYLASVESLADHSENEYTGKQRPPLSLLERACLEIIHTEQNYVSDLNQVIQGYLNSWRQNSALTEPHLKTLFCNIKEIHQFNSELLEKLDLTGKDARKIARTFIDCCQGFNVYTEYCTNYPHATSLLTELLQSKITSGLLRDTQSRLGHKLPLGSYLLKPVQRIMKYHLLFQNLRKHYDTADIVEALELMTGVARHIDQVKQKKEQQSRVQELEGSLDGWLGPSLTVLGELCLEGTLQERNHKPRQAFLFDKMLLLTKRKEDGRLAYKSHIMGSNLMLVESVQGEPTSFHVIPYDNPRNQVTLQARSVAQKKQWGLQLKRVMLEQFNAEIPTRAKALVLGLGNEDEYASPEQMIPSKKNHSAPEYLERRQERRKSELSSRRFKKGRKLDLSFKSNLSHDDRKPPNNHCSCTDNSKCTHGSDKSIVESCKEKRYSSWYLNEDHNCEKDCNCFDYTKQEIVKKDSPLHEDKKFYSSENIVNACTENSLKSNAASVKFKRSERREINKFCSWRRKSEPGIPSGFFIPLPSITSQNAIKGNTDDEFVDCMTTIVRHDQKSATLGYLKPPIKSFEIKQYNAKTLPKKISKIKKNRAKTMKTVGESTFYTDFSDFSANENILHISESTDSIAVNNDTVENVENVEIFTGVVDTETAKTVENESNIDEAVEAVEALDKQEENENDFEQDGTPSDSPERPVEEIISQMLMEKRDFKRVLKKQSSKKLLMLKKSLSDSQTKPVLVSKDSFDCTSRNSTPDILDNDSEHQQDVEEERKTDNEPLYESLKESISSRNSPIVTDKIYSDIRIKYRKKSSVRPDSDYVVLKYTEEGLLKTNDNNNKAIQSTPDNVKKIKPIRQLNLIEDPKLKEIFHPESNTINSSTENVKNLDYLDLQNEIDKLIMERISNDFTDVHKNENVCKVNSSSLLKQNENVTQKSTSETNEVSHKPSFSRSNSKSLIQRFKNIIEEPQPTKCNSDSLLTKRRSEVNNENKLQKKSEKLPIYKQGSENLGSRIAHVDYADPRMLFGEINSSNLLINKNSIRPDSVFSLTSSNDSVFDPKYNNELKNKNTKVSLKHKKGLENEYINSSQTDMTSSAIIGKSSQEIGFYERNVEDSLENDNFFRDSAIYSDDNDRKDYNTEIIEASNAVVINKSKNYKKSLRQLVITSDSNSFETTLSPSDSPKVTVSTSKIPFQSSKSPPVVPRKPQILSPPPIPIKPVNLHKSPSFEKCSKPPISVENKFNFIADNEDKETENSDPENFRNSKGWVKHVIGKFQ